MRTRPTFWLPSEWAPRQQVKKNPIKADPELIKKVTNAGWLDKNCNVGYVSMKKLDYQDCVKVDAALLKPYDPAKADYFGKDYDPEKYYKCRIEKKRSRSSFFQARPVAHE